MNLKLHTKIIILIIIFLVSLTSAYVIMNPGYSWARVKLVLSLVGEKDNQQQGNDNTPAATEIGDPNEIRIPSLGIEAPLIYAVEKNETAFQKNLENGVVHYPDTALLGQVGNSYFFGHSSDMVTAPGNYKTVFALLPNIQNGAEILISDPAGRVFRYKVYDQFVVENKDLQVLDQNTNGKKILSLQTSYPVGTALKRYIVKAELVE